MVLNLRSRRPLLIQLLPLRLKPLLRRIFHEPLTQRINRPNHGKQPSIPNRIVLQPLHLTHTLPIIDRQLILQKPHHPRLKRVPRLFPDVVVQTSIEQLLSSQFAAKHKKVVRAMNADRLRKGQRGPVFRHETKRAKRTLQPRGGRGEDNISNAREPSCAAADGGAIEGEDEDFSVVDHGAEELLCWGGDKYMSWRGGRSAVQYKPRTKPTSTTGSETYRTRISAETSFSLQPRPSGCPARCAQLMLL